MCSQEEKLINDKTAKWLGNIGGLGYTEYFLNGSLKVVGCVSNKIILRPVNCPNKEYTYIHINRPTYMQVWMWLWREKKQSITLTQDSNDKWEADIFSGKAYITKSDPEEAIIAAIEYIIDYNLIDY